MAPRPRPLGPWPAAYRQRNSFSARVKHTTSQTPNTPNCGATCARPAPCSMWARSASITAVKGSARIAVAARRETVAPERTPGDDPHGHHYRVHQPEAASMVWAREAISNPRALNASDPKTHSTARSSRNRARAPEMPRRQTPPARPLPPPAVAAAPARTRAGSHAAAWASQSGAS